MKNLLLYSFILIAFLHSKAQTTVYHKFPDSNAIWCDKMWAHICVDRSYIITGDTIVNGEIYHKLYENAYGCQVGISGVCECNISSGYYSNYAGAIRQDTILRKVYFLQPSNTKDTLLYDFSLLVGDTLKTYIEDNHISLLPSTPIIITSIDSILIGTSYRKRWIVNRSNDIVNAQIIEGIGSTSGLFNWMINVVPPVEPVDHLYCFSQNNQTLYPYYSVAASCQLVTGIESANTQKPTFQVFPNPNNGNFIIELNDNNKQTMQINDVTGHLVLKQTIYGKTSIDGSGFPEGMYNVSILNEETIVNKKLVIIR